MRNGKLRIPVIILATVFSKGMAQDEVGDVCYGAESIAVAVAGTLIVTLGLFAIGLLLYKNYWKVREGKHLILVTDVESPSDQYAFDNPCFREATPIKQNGKEEKNTSSLDKKKWLAWSPLNPFGKDQKMKKMTSLDDSCVTNSKLKIVTLKSHDFTGLGFNICGNMRDGIFIKDVLHRGPAFESGCINSGDRIDSVCISFRNMVFEDALTILSYASPYDVQVQVENVSYSRPSTLIRSKRESNMLSSTDKIFHPKYSRSQSISHLNEIGISNNKQILYETSYGTHEKNRINQSLNRSNDESNYYPTIQLLETTETKKDRLRFEKNAASMASQPSKKATRQDQSSDLQNKHQKFGIKVLPMNINLKDQPKTTMIFENEINAEKDTLDKQGIASLPSDSEINKCYGPDEVDGSKDNVRTILAKGFQNLKDKLNQNTLGKKKRDINDDIVVESNDKKRSDTERTAMQLKSGDAPLELSEGECPISRAVGENGLMVPEEVSRAGDVARSNRKSLNDSNSCRISLANFVTGDIEGKEKTEKDPGSVSDSENSTDGDSRKIPDEAKKAKRSKGKAPAPPVTDQLKDGKSSIASKQFKNIEADDLKRNGNDNPEDRKRISDDLEEKIIQSKDNKDGIEDRHRLSSFDSDSDTESRCPDEKTRPNNTKIELTALQVTVHHSPSSDGNDEEMEPSRKAASLGDLSRLDSDQSVSAILERAVSLDLADGAGQSNKKRKAPLPPSEEFPTDLDNLNAKKEPRLDTSRLNTFQRRLKKSSDFGTLEDAIQDGPKSLEMEINRQDSSPVDLMEAHNSNIQEFSTWLAECRRPKSSIGKTSDENSEPLNLTPTALEVIPNTTKVAQQPDFKCELEYQTTSKIDINGKNFSTDVQTITGSNNGEKSTTVVVISQPNSLGTNETVSKVNADYCDKSNTGPSGEVEDQLEESSAGRNEGSTTLGSFVTARQSKSEGFVDAEEEQSPPPKFPTSPMPSLTSSIVSSPLSSTRTYITEIKVSTSQGRGNDMSIPQDIVFPSSLNYKLGVDGASIKTSTPRPMDNSIAKKIQQFDSRSGFSNFIGPLKSKSDFDVTPESNSEPSKIPVKTMKSETGQKLLATIQSLATKTTSPPKLPEVEYAKRVASLFSGATSPERNQVNMRRRSEESGTVSLPTNHPGFYLKESDAQTERSIRPIVKVPPAVPPRKIETALSNKSTGSIDLPGNSASISSEDSVSSDTKERGVVTFSSFIPKNKTEESASSTLISFKIK